MYGSKKMQRQKDDKYDVKYGFKEKIKSQN
jgi:hypothetical protein